VPVTDQGRDFAGRIIAAGYLWPLMKLLVLAASILLLSNRATAFGLAVLVPITVVIVWFQSTLNPLPVPVATTFTVVICELLLVKAYASRFAGMFNDRTECYCFPDTHYSKSVLYSSGLNPTVSLPSASSTGRLIREG
jgi:hypothetical protein